MLSRMLLVFVLLISGTALAEEHYVHIKYVSYVNIDEGTSIQEFIKALENYKFTDVKWRVQRGVGRHFVWYIDAKFQSDIKRGKDELGKDEWVGNYKDPEFMTEEQKKAYALLGEMSPGVFITNGKSEGPKVTFTYQGKRQRGYVSEIMGPWYRPNRCSVYTSSADALCSHLGMARKDFPEFDTEAKMQIAAAVVLCLSNGGSLFCGAGEDDPLPTPVPITQPTIRSPYAYPRSSPMHYRRYR